MTAAMVVDADVWEDAAQVSSDLVAEARSNPHLFNRLVLRDEQTGAETRSTDLHAGWHAQLTKHDRVVLWSHVESGKTVSVAIGRTLWMLARNQALRCAVVSNTARQAEKVLRTIKRYVETSDVLRAVSSGKLKPAEPWSDSAITVERSIIAKDPTVQALGIHGAVLGSRIDWLVLDDVLDFENTSTDRARKKTIEWFNSSLAGRLTANARVVVIGTAFSPDDLLFYLAKLPGWTALRYPVVDDAGKPRWPERWTPDRISRARETMGPVEFARQLLCKPRSDEDAKFKRAWVERALELGDGRDPVASIPQVPPGWRVFTGVDLAVQQHAAADLTCLFTIGVAPDGMRQVLSCESGRWAGPEIVDRVAGAHRRYGSVCVVENNSAQDFLVQFLRASTAVPVLPYTTGRAKASPEFGVERIATEMANGKWSIPNRGGRMVPEIQAWVDELLYYSPQAHTGDRLMASWLAVEGLRIVADQGKVEGMRLPNLMAR